MRSNKKDEKKKGKPGFEGKGGMNGAGPKGFSMRRSAAKISVSSEFADGGVSSFVPRKKQRK
jgi:hypothetical protein